jgi:hypothetical protein
MQLRESSMSEAETATSQPDPMEKMRELRDTYLETWSKYLIETVNSESYAKASGAALNSYLNVAAPLKEPTEQALLRTLEQLHIPTSVDFAGLAGRITNIEMQLDNADAKLDRIEKLLTAMQPSIVAKPAKSRTRAASKTAAQTKSPRRAGRAAKPGLHSARKGKK